MLMLRGKTKYVTTLLAFEIVRMLIADEHAQPRLGRA